MGSQSALGRLGNVGRQSVERLREIVGSGDFHTFAAVDRQTGEVLNPEARALFASLPTVSSATAPEELLEHGLLPALPKAWSQAFGVPRYSVDAQVFVRTTVTHQPTKNALPVGGFDPSGDEGFTHLGRLKARQGDVFWVDVMGSERWLPFSRADIYAWNQPCGVASSGGGLSGVNVDHTDPLWKAHVCAAYLTFGKAIAAVDFSQETKEPVQAALVHQLASRVRMDYAGRGEGYAGTRAGALLSQGQGVCFVQRAVAAAFLQAFSRVLAFDVQAVVGASLSLSLPRGFVVVTLRPSLRRYVCDPAWNEPLTDLRVAFHDAAWGHDRRLLGMDGHVELTVPPSDVELPELGDVS